MATFFYAMLRIIRLQGALKATVHQVIFRDLIKTQSNVDAIRECVECIESQSFFRALYVLLRAVFPALCVLRYCDSNEPMMDKVYYLTYRASEALKKSVPHLDDEGLFMNMMADSELEFTYQNEVEEVDGEEDNDERFVLLYI